MKTINIDKIPPGPELDALVAEKVMGWKNVYRHGTAKDDEHDHYVGRKQDKIGRWRLAAVRPYSTDPGILACAPFDLPGRGQVKN